MIAYQCHESSDVVVIGYRLIETANKFEGVNCPKGENPGVWMIEAGLTQCIIFKSHRISLSLSKRDEEYMLSMLAHGDNNQRLEVPKDIADQISCCVLGGYNKAMGSPLNTGVQYFTCTQEEYHKYQKELLQMTEQILEVKAEFQTDREGFCIAINKLSHEISLPKGTSQQDFVRISLQIFEKIEKDHGPELHN